VATGLAALLVFGVAAQVEAQGAASERCSVVVETRLAIESEPAGARVAGARVRTPMALVSLGVWFPGWRWR
jgi:hypothetical protein